MVHAKICGFPDDSLVSYLPLSTPLVTHLQPLVIVARLRLIKHCSTVPLQAYALANSGAFTIRTNVKTLDRIRVFRRRQDSPSRSPDRLEARDRSPSWFQRMHRNMSSSKRSRSSSAQPEARSEVGGSDAQPTMDTARDLEPDPPIKMPAFLQQSQGGKCNLSFRVFLVFKSADS